MPFDVAGFLEEDMGKWKTTILKDLSALKALF